ncbi:hypothetical protein QQX13_12770 [Demequina sp. SYSU T00068]|uniref:hypothetical protein n=1 Tax=Demequina lignilytica TaxID=3051663 RepID=UPI002637FC8C|nr:hypothetical protein [Demequina sp. SYSU T00068]MDN4491708.1 hypothetical protein [Demequina sp. SYSU T00068]
MTRSTLKPALLAVAAAIGLAVAMATPASARTEVDRYEFPMGRLYDNHIAPTSGVTALEQDLVVIVGFSAPQFCADAPPELADELDRISGDGTMIHERLVNQRATMEVYDGGGLGVFDYFAGVYCPALAAGDPPEPVGVGVANLQDRSVVDISAFPEVTISSVNSAHGTVVTGSGERWAVSTYAEVDLYLVIDPVTDMPIVFEQYPSVTSVDVRNRR